MGTRPDSNRTLGPVMLDVAGRQLAEEELDRLTHPLVGGVILFARNFASPDQLIALTDAIRAARPGLIIAVDHEGGRVQRFREGFTRIPAMRRLGDLWEDDRTGALRTARCAGYVLASELRACGVDLSFTPVLDLDYGSSSVIGDRAFHRDPAVVASLAGALNAGLADAGMASVGKHFPGHGFVSADSHVAVPVDARPMDEIRSHDLIPFALHRGMRLAAVMPAHVIYERIDPRPAGFSPFWLQTVLRGELGFEGVIFSDDLSMEGASVAGDIVERAQAAVTAGCDMVLVCNAPGAASELLSRWRPNCSVGSAERLSRLLPTLRPKSRDELEQDQNYRDAVESVARLARV